MTITRKSFTYALIKNIFSSNMYKIIPMISFRILECFKFTYVNVKEKTLENV